VRDPGGSPIRIAGRVFRTTPANEGAEARLRWIASALRTSGLATLTLPNGAVESAALTLVGRVVEARSAPDVLAGWLQYEDDRWSLAGAEEIARLLRSLPFEGVARLDDRAVAFELLANLCFVMACEWPRFRTIAQEYADG
jgi:hypothetical protein